MYKPETIATCQELLGDMRIIGTSHMASAEADAYRTRIDAALADLASTQPAPTVTIPDEVREAIRVCASYGMPLGITYAEYNAARDKVVAWLDATQGGKQ